MLQVQHFRVNIFQKNRLSPLWLKSNTSTPEAKKLGFKCLSSDLAPSPTKLPAQIPQIPATLDIT